MKFRLLTIILTAFSFITQVSAQSHKIEVSIDNVNDSSLILGYYFNKKILVKDTTYITSKGNYVFQGDEPLEQGLYVVYLEDQTYFDLMIGEDQSFSVTTSKNNLLQSMKISGSDESMAFTKYQQYLVSRQKEAKNIQDKRKAVTDENEKKSLEVKLNKLSSDAADRYKQVVDEFPGSFLSVFLNATQEVQVPDMKAPDNCNNPDSAIQRKRYDYYKNHYFDNIKMDDERILRTPFFTNKLEYYFNKILIQIPDTIIKESHRVIALANGNYKMEKYLIQNLFNMANESKIMGMDAVMVNLGETYYLSGRADWVDDEFLKNLEERVNKIKPNLLGGTAADFMMESFTGEFYRLSEVDAEITILVFWEPECGHCEKEIPKLNSEVWQKYSDQNIKIVAVYTQWEKDSWIEFIHSKNLEEWIHLYDPYNRSNFRNNYDIYSTPVVYILDKDKKILAKRIGTEQIPGFLDHHFKLN